MGPKERVKNLIAEIAEISPKEIGDDTHFRDDLDLDSMLVLEMLAELEREFAIKIPEEELSEFTTLNNVSAVVMKRLPAAVA